MFMRLDFQPGVDVERTPTTMRGGWVDSNLVRVREGKYEKHLGWQRIINTPVQGRARGIHYWTDLQAIPWLAIGTTQRLYVINLAQLPGGTSPVTSPLPAFTISVITPAGWTGGQENQVSGNYATPLIWSLDNFGQDLLAWPSGGGFYYWQPPATNPAAGFAPALPVTYTGPPPPGGFSGGPPAYNIGGFVAMPQQIVFAYGCTSSTAAVGEKPNPLQIRWSDQQDFTSWFPTTTNQAGGYIIPRGSRIIGGLSSILGNFFWSDLDFWSAQYSGLPFVFGFQNIGPNTGLLARNAAVATGNAIFWASDHGFFLFGGGGPQPIPCTLWDQFYNNIVHAQQEKVVAGTDQHHNEVYFFFPSIAGNGTNSNSNAEIDSYLKYNFVENVWDFGSATPEMANLLSRTCWTDQNRPGGPFSVDLNGLIQQSDIGVDADGVAMAGVSLTSGYYDVDEGQGIMFVDQLLPDFLWNQSTVANPSLQMTLLFRNWPGDTPTVKGPFKITPETKYVTCRCRGREVAVKIECDSPGTWFRMGTPRLRAARDGRI